MIKGLETMVIEAAFLTALGWFALAAAWRAMRRRGSEGPPALPGGRVGTWGLHPVDLLGIGMVFLVYAGFFVLNSTVPDKDPTQRLTPGTLVVAIAVQFAIAGMVMAFLAPRVRLGAFFGLTWKGWPWVFLIGPLVLGTMWLLFGGMAELGYFRWMERLLGESPVQDVVKVLKVAKNPTVVALMAVTAVIVAPLCEEIVFRGYLYAVAKRFGGRWTAACCSALLFSAAHGSLAALLPLFLFGLLLVVVYERTGSLWAPIAGHFFFNAATVVVQLGARLFHLPLAPP